MNKLDKYISRIPNRLRKQTPGIIKNFYHFYQIYKQQRYERIYQLPIQKSGLTKDGLPYVELDDGVVFYGYPPTKIQYYIYRRFLRSGVKKRLHKEAVGVAYDIILRYLDNRSNENFLASTKYFQFKKGDCVVEIGAYTGFNAMQASKIVGEEGCVVAIEPVPANYHIILKNIAANGFDNIIPVNLAVWNYNGKIKLYLNDRQHAVSVVYEHRSTDNTLDIPCETVDSILSRLKCPNPSFVRIMVNGAELEALKGMKDTIANVQKIFIKLPERQQIKCDLICSYLQQSGYQIIAGSDSILGWR